MLFDNLERFPPVSVLATKLSIEKLCLQIYCLFCFCQSFFQDSVCYWSYFVLGKLCVFPITWRPVSGSLTVTLPPSVSKTLSSSDGSLVVLFSCRGRMTTARNPSHRLPVLRSKPFQAPSLVVFTSKNTTSGRSQFLSSFPLSLVGPTIPRPDAANYR